MSDKIQTQAWLEELLRVESRWLDAYLARQPMGRCLRILPKGVIPHQALPGDATASFESRMDAFADAHGLSQPLRCSLQDAAIANHALDLVVLQHVLDTQAQPTPWLTQAMRWVRPGGHLILIHFNRFSAWHLLGRCRFATAEDSLSVQPRWAERDRSLLLRHDFACEPVQHLGSVLPQALQTADAHEGWLARYRAVHVVVARKQSGQVIALRDLIAKRAAPHGGFTLNPSTRVWQHTEAA